MSQSYYLPQTYAPTPEFEILLERLAVDAAQLCRCAGVHPATYERMQKLRTTSRRTAARLACGVALAHGAMHPYDAFRLLFTPRPRVVMEQRAGDTRYQRRCDAGACCGDLDQGACPGSDIPAAERPPRQRR
jgi:hypothetical protein